MLVVEARATSQSTVVAFVARSIKFPRERGDSHQTRGQDNAT